MGNIWSIPQWRDGQPPETSSPTACTSSLESKGFWRKRAFVVRYCRTSSFETYPETKSVRAASFALKTLS